MSSYNSFERAIARMLSKAPFLKQMTKKAYARLAYLKNKKGYTHRSMQEPKPVVDFQHASSFFGYYDKSPSSSDGSCLVHLTDQSAQGTPSPAMSVTLALMVPDQKEPIWQQSISAYNWQQGCKAHWLSDRYFIYNDFDSGKDQYISRVVSKETLEAVREFPLPVQDSYGMDYLLCINYRRLMALRPDYGYRNLPPLSAEELADTDSDGIWKVDYQTGDNSLLVPLSAMSSVCPGAEFSRSTHKVNHVLISPSGQRFAFLHQYFVNGRRFDRLMLADADGGNLALVSDYGMVSHYFWVDDDTLLGYLRGPNGKDAYWLIDLHTLRFSSVADGALDRFGDGHPHVHGEWFVTDTYPDKARMQHLLLCNWKTGELRELGEFFHGFDYEGESRCDLHPRFSPDGKSVFFDSVFTGQRRLYRMSLEE